LSFPFPSIDVFIRKDQIKTDHSLTNYRTQQSSSLRDTIDIKDSITTLRDSLSTTKVKSVDDLI